MDEDGVLTFAKAGDPDAVTPYLNPYTAIGPVGERTSLAAVAVVGVSPQA